MQTKYYILGIPENYSIGFTSIEYFISPYSPYSAYLYRLCNFISHFK